MASFRLPTPTQGLIGCTLALAIIGIGLPSTTASGNGSHVDGLRLNLMVQEWNAATEAFRRDHGRWPGFEPGPMLERQASVEQLRHDLLQPAGTSTPYLSEWPIHPQSGSSNVRMLDGKLTTTNRGRTPAWIWRPALGQVRTDPRALRPSAIRSW